MLLIVRIGRLRLELLLLKKVNAVESEYKCEFCGGPHKNDDCDAGKADVAEVDAVNAVDNNEVGRSGQSMARNNYQNPGQYQNQNQNQNWNQGGGGNKNYNNRNKN